MMTTLGAAKGFGFLNHRANDKHALFSPHFQKSNKNLLLDFDDKMRAKRAVTNHSQPGRQVSLVIKALKTPNSCTAEFNRKSFSNDFIFGTASSAYQCEGGVFEDFGKGPSIWDIFSNVYPGKIVDRTNGDVSIDSFNNYKEDVRIMKEMGVDAYRFSISWSRILPYGKLSRGVNERGLMYYHNLINELIANGIKPVATIFHFDTPQYLQDAYGGFFSPAIMDDFRDFADLCFSEFGDKVKYWITINEPLTYSLLWYPIGIEASKKCRFSGDCKDDKGTMPYLVTHHQLLCHAVAADLYKKHYQNHQKGEIGITLNTDYFYPLKSDSEEDSKAAQRALDWWFGWFMDPITRGQYPDTMQRLVGDRLPKFTEEQSRLLTKSFDFLGLNYYSSSFTTDAPHHENMKPHYEYDGLYKTTKYDIDGNPIGETAEPSDFMYIHPQGLRYLLKHTKDKYDDPLIIITENGMGEIIKNEAPPGEALNDEQRRRYYQDHLQKIHEAINEDKVNVKGYFAWSINDNYEWTHGANIRFGMNYVDYNDPKRTRYMKNSAKWYKEFLNPEAKN